MLLFKPELLKNLPKKTTKQEETEEKSLKNVFQTSTSQKDVSKEQNFLSETYLWQYDTQTNYVCTSELLDSCICKCHSFYAEFIQKWKKKSSTKGLHFI